MFFEWKDEYAFGIQIIDDQHKKFVETLNKLHDAIVSDQTKEMLSGIFWDLSEYAVFHFNTEEMYFEEFGYEGAEDHKKHHREFREKMIEFQNQYNEGKASISIDLMKFLEDWLTNHLRDVDAKYVQCFKEHGLK